MIALVKCNQVTTKMNTYKNKTEWLEPLQEAKAFILLHIESILKLNWSKGIKGINEPSLPIFLALIGENIL